VKGKKIQQNNQRGGEGGSHLDGTNTGNEGEKDQAGDGEEDEDNRKGRGSKGKEIQQNNQQRGEEGSQLGGTNTPNDGEKDQGGAGGEDDDNRKGGGVKGEDVQQNNQRDVLVTVFTGSEHHVWDKHPVPEQLVGSHITPTLTFLFKKAKRTIKSNVLVECCMNEESSQLDGERCGWFQHKLDVSLQCLKLNAARRSPSKLLGSETLKETYMKQEQATPGQLTVGLAGGTPGIGSLQAAWTKLLASKLQSQQITREISLEFIGGSRFLATRADGGGPKPSSKYTFKLWPEIPSNKLPDRSDEENFKGMLCTVSPNFEANWTLLCQDVCEYELKVERHVRELVLVAGKPKLLRKQNFSCDCNDMVQTYRVILHINHDMSNIETFEETEVALWEGNPRNKLVELIGHRGDGFLDEASYSTQ
jgi:hypothetical protein